MNRQVNMIAHRPDDLAGLPDAVCGSSVRMIPQLLSPDFRTLTARRARTV